MTLQDFFNAHNGKKVDYDGNFGYQCKDLFSFYNRDIAKNPDYVRGNAWELYEKCPPAYYKKVSSPTKGDVAVWQKALGGFGHVAIYWGNNQFFSQNYPIGAACSLQTIPTTLLLGYLRPLNLAPMPFDQYNEKIIRNTKTGAYALVIRGKKFQFSGGLDVVALITWMQRNHMGNFASVDDQTYNSIPLSQGLSF